MYIHTYIMFIHGAGVRGGGWTNPVFEIIVLNWNIFQKSSQKSPNPRLIVCARAPLRMGLYIHTHMHACKHARTRMLIHTHTYTYTRLGSHARMCVCVRADVILADYFVKAVTTIICFVLLQQTVDERTNVLCV